jgi:hypothetical protein
MRRLWSFGFRGDRLKSGLEVVGMDRRRRIGLPRDFGERLAQALGALKRRIVLRLFPLLMPLLAVYMLG